MDLIAIVGKEPFADDRGIRVLRHLHARREEGQNFRYGVVTNGTLLERYIDELPPTISYVDVSLDGAEGKTDAMRGSGVYAKATQAIKELVKRGRDVWISSVMYADALTPKDTVDFMYRIASETGCKKFYLSPVRNFTGRLEQMLVSFRRIREMQQLIADSVLDTSIVERVILDHPYESVWRDYFAQTSSQSQSRLELLKIDRFGNVLHQLSQACFRKLDVFPHGPWGTCRVDARGEYLSDVEARTFAHPKSIGNIESNSADNLHDQAIALDLEPMLERFLQNMVRSMRHSEDDAALKTVSVPLNA